MAPASLVSPKDYPELKCVRVDLDYVSVVSIAWNILYNVETNTINITSKKLSWWGHRRVCSYSKFSNNCFWRKDIRYKSLLFENYYCCRKYWKSPL